MSMGQRVNPHNIRVKPFEIKSKWYDETTGVEVNDITSEIDGSCLTHELDLAINYIVKKINEHNLDRPYEQQIDISVKRMQNLLYFSQGIYIRYTGRPMFQEEFYAWPSGPVIPVVFDKYMENGFHPKEILSIVPKEMQEVLDFVAEIISSISLRDFESINKGPDSPWRKFYNPFDRMHLQIIPKDIIANHWAVIYMEESKELCLSITKKIENKFKNLKNYSK